MKIIIALAFIILTVLTVRVAFIPRRSLPRNRVRYLRWRLYLHLHPGRGIATAFEIWWRWGSFASFRQSRRMRPSLIWLDRLNPRTHSYMVGRAHYQMRVRVPVQEHGGVMGPPRSYKTALLSHMINDAPGPVVCTSSKADLYSLTAAIRARKGPVWVFNPQGVGGIPSNVRWSPLDGCQFADVAIRRADAFAGAVAAGGTEDGSFWSVKAADGLRALFAAAALARKDMRRVTRWVGSHAETPEAVAVLESAAWDDFAVLAAELNGPAEKTTQTIRMVMQRALQFMLDPAIAATVLPRHPEDAFDIEEFVRSSGTLYMIARNASDECVVAPLFAALAAEIQHAAVTLGSHMPGHRLDPPALFALDEVTQICPVPLPAWLADSGGQGVAIWYGCHGVAQLRARWGEHKAQAILDTTNVRLFLPGLADTATIDQAVHLAGKVAYGSDDHRQHEDAISAAMLRGLPAGRALALRGSCAPAIIRLARGWEHRSYRKGQEPPDIWVPAIIPPAPRGPVPPARSVPPAQPVPAAVGGGYPWQEAEGE
jgi:hypothetical protein